MSQVSNRYCTEARGFDPSGQLPRYGLTCGYWTNVPKNLDNHVIKDQCYDLFDGQYELDKIARQLNSPTPPPGGVDASDCKVTVLPGGGMRVEAL